MHNRKQSHWKTNNKRPWTFQLVYISKNGGFAQQKEATRCSSSYEIDSSWFVALLFSSTYGKASYDVFFDLNYFKTGLRHETPLHVLLCKNAIFLKLFPGFAEKTSKNPSNKNQQHKFWNAQKFQSNILNHGLFLRFSAIDSMFVGLLVLSFSWMIKLWFLTSINFEAQRKAFLDAVFRSLFEFSFEQREEMFASSTFEDYFSTANDAPILLARSRAIDSFHIEQQPLPEYSWSVNILISKLLCSLLIQSR